MTLADEAYERAVEVLRQNVTPLGFKASAELNDAVWARDAGVAVLGALLTGRDDLKEASRRTLEALAEAQSELGQIPNWRDATGRRNYYATDATAWWVIAVARLGSDAGEDGLSAGLLPSVQRALTWLRYQAIDASGLLHSPPAADWMDSSLQRWGKVFYVNVLYCAALQAAGVLRGSGATYAADLERVRRSLNGLFWPEEGIDEEWLSGWGKRFYEEQVDPQREHYLNFLTFEAYDTRCDVLANCLAILWDLADGAKAARILDYVASRRLAAPYPVRVLDPPAFTADRSWNPKTDLDRPAHWRNPPFGFHNAGVWPWVGGFYVAALVKAGRHGEAEAALERLAAACRVGRQGEWEFNEWLDGRTGEPLGAVRQTWSAAGYIIAYRAVADRAVSWAAG